MAKQEPDAEVLEPTIQRAVRRLNRPGSGLPEEIANRCAILANRSFVPNL
jgi:hypothetical protein